MIFIALLVFFAASAGIWFWIVKNRGSFNLWLANLAGALATFIIGVVVLIFIGAEPQAARGPAYFLYSFMAIIGAFVGTWLLVINRLKREESQVRNHLIAGSCSLLAAFITLVVWAVIFPAK